MKYRDLISYSTITFKNEFSKAQKKNQLCVGAEIWELLTGRC